MRLIPLFMCLFLAATLPVAAQEWEVGAGAGYGVSRGADVTSPYGTIRAGFTRGVVLGAYGAQNWEHFSGELHYSYKFSDLKVDGHGQSVTLDGEVHSVHYDFLLHPGERHLQPYVAMGVGMRYYRGTGIERESQPLGIFAVLTHTSQVKPLLAPGVGVKVKAGHRFVIRLDLRDFITPFPEQVITPYPRAQAEVHGWLHDFTPMVNVGLTF